MRLSLSLGLLLAFILACGGGEPEAPSELGDVKALCDARLPECAGDTCTDAEIDTSFAEAKVGTPWGQALAKKFQEGPEVGAEPEYELAAKIFEHKAEEKDLDCIIVIAGLKFSEPELFEEGGRFFGMDKTAAEKAATAGAGEAGAAPVEGAAAPAAEGAEAPAAHAEGAPAAAPAAPAEGAPAAAQ